MTHAALLGALGPEILAACARRAHAGHWQLHGPVCSWLTKADVGSRLEDSATVEQQQVLHFVLSSGQSVCVEQLHQGAVMLVAKDAARHGPLDAGGAGYADQWYVMCAPPALGVLVQPCTA